MFLRAHTGLAGVSEGACWFAGWSQWLGEEHAGSHAGAPVRPNLWPGVHTFACLRVPWVSQAMQAASQASVGACLAIACIAAILLNVP